MQNWSRFAEQWEEVIRSSLSGVPDDFISDAEQLVLRDGIALPNSRVEPVRAQTLLMASGLQPDTDYVDFLARVGGINLIAMGADDGILFGAADVGPLRVRAPSMYAALLDGAQSTSMDMYLACEYVVDPVGLLPLKVVESAVAISTSAGAKMYAVAPLGDGNDYLRISIHGDSIRYSSFEEFIVTERDLMIESLRDSIEERLESP